MCKFHDIKGDGYEQVASNISFLAEEVLKDVPARDNILNCWCTYLYNLDPNETNIRECY